MAWQARHPVATRAMSGLLFGILFAGGTKAFDTSRSWFETGLLALFAGVAYAAVLYLVIDRRQARRPEVE